MLNDALLTGAGVIHAHLLAGPQRGRHDFTGAIDDPRGCPESEAERALLALDHNRFAGLIRIYRARRIGCSRFCSRQPPENGGS